MKKLSKEQILEFLAELAAPVSPEIFAGFGSDFQRNRYKWEKQNQEIDKEEEYISAWIEEQEGIQYITRKENAVSSIVTLP